jgi:uncharacterized protein YlzI (FlbEa/FlbD family)
MNDTKHHKYGMSKWPAINHCAHFEQRKDDRPSEEASKGNMAHLIFSALLTGNKAWRDEGKDIFNTAKWAADCAEAEKAVCNEVKDYGAEETLTFPKIKGLKYPKGLFGTPDYYMIAEDEGGKFVLVADLKTFSNGLNNYFDQLKGYALCVAGNEDTSMRVKLCVAHGLARKWETMETTIGECIESAREIFQRISNKEDYPQRMNVFCKFCEHRTTCEESKKVIKTVMRDDGGYSLLNISREDMLANPIMAVRAMVVAKEAEMVIERLKEYFREVIETKGEEDSIIVRDYGKEVELKRKTLSDEDCGFRFVLKEQKPSREIKDKDALIGRLFERFKVGELVGSDCLKVSLPKIKDLLACDGTMTQEEIDAFIIEHTTEGKPETRLERVY